VASAARHRFGSVGDARKCDPKRRRRNATAGALQSGDKFSAAQSLGPDCTLDLIEIDSGSFLADINGRDRLHLLQIDYFDSARF
jgi:hypothetical protein